MLDIGNQEAALRKMFVAAPFRGSELGVAKPLLDTLLDWSRAHAVHRIYLGTTAGFLAAHRFYEKNGFRKINPSELPSSFPIMKVDAKFYTIVPDGGKPNQSPQHTRPAVRLRMIHPHPKLRPRPARVADLWSFAKMSARDRANGYEVMATAFMSTRSSIGEEVVRKWARRLPRGGSVLDLGCGHGVPISQALIEEGLAVHGIDASPSMIAAFRQRFPSVPSERSAIEESDFFHRTFDGVVAWGLMFLLAPDIQALVVRKVSQALFRGGRFLFTAPSQACEWLDVLTGLKSVSLGAERYCRMLAVEGLTVIAQDEDEGENHYYFAEKVAEPLPQHNAGGRPSSMDSPAPEPPSSAGPRG